MRFVLIGAVAFSLRCLEELFGAGADVSGVVTLPQAAAAQHGDYADLRPLAAEHGVPVHETLDVNAPDTLRWLRHLEPDLVFVAGWSQIVSSELLALPRVGCIGSHPALLPCDRGRHPITWALVDGYEESGLTFFWLDEGADSGDIVWQRPFPIGFDDDAADVYARIEELGSVAIRELVPQLQAGTAPRIPQDHAAATYRRKRTDADRWLDWGRSSRELHNLVRGLARPYVGALTRLGDCEIQIWRSRLPQGTDPENGAGAEPGTIMSVGDAGVSICTGDSHLTLIDFEPRRPAGLEPGARFEGAP